MSSAVVAIVPSCRDRISAGATFKGDGSPVCSSCVNWPATRSPTFQTNCEYLIGPTATTVPAASDASEKSCGTDAPKDSPSEPGIMLSLDMGNVPFVTILGPKSRLSTRGESTTATHASRNWTEPASSLTNTSSTPYARHVSVSSPELNGKYAHGRGHFVLDQLQGVDAARRR